MRRLVSVSGASHRYLLAHGFISIVSFLALRIAIYVYDIPWSCLIASITCTCMWAYTCLCNRPGLPNRPTAPTGGRRGYSALQLHVGGFVWPVAEVLTMHSLVFNTIGLHFLGLFILFCVCSLPGLYSIMSARSDQTEGGRRVALALKWTGVSLLGIGVCLAFVGLYYEEHQRPGTMALAILMVLVYCRAEWAAAHPRTYAEEHPDDNGILAAVTVSPFACVLLPLASAVFVDDYRLYGWRDFPSVTGMLLLLAGCAGRTGAQALLEKAVYYSRPGTQEDRVTRRDQVLLFAIEYLICVLFGYYFLCENMSWQTVLPELLTFLCLALYYATVEGSADCSPRFTDTSAVWSRSHGRLVPTVASLHNGFYVQYPCTPHDDA